MPVITASDDLNSVRIDQARLFNETRKFDIEVVHVETGPRNFDRATPEKLVTFEDEYLKKAYTREGEHTENSSAGKPREAWRAT